LTIAATPARSSVATACFNGHGLLQPRDKLRDMRRVRDAGIGIRVVGEDGSGRGQKGNQGKGDAHPGLPLKG
jgi:hypothetical protein